MFHSRYFVVPLLAALSVAASLHFRPVEPSNPAVVAGAMTSDLAEH